MKKTFPSGVKNSNMNYHTGKTREVELVLGEERIKLSFLNELRINTKILS